MKIGIGIAAALVLAVVAFLGLRGVLDDGGAGDAATEAATAVDGEGAELEDRLADAGAHVDGEEAFAGAEWSLDVETPSEVEPEGDSSTHTVEVEGTATLTLPDTVGPADRDLLLFGDAAEESLPITVEIELAEGEDGWEPDGVAIDDPYPRPPEPEESEISGVSGTAREAADAALSLLGPGFYEQPDVYATETDAPKQEWLDARAENDRSYPPYLVDVPQAALITGPVDRALVVAMGCEYNTADAEIELVEPATGAPDASPAGHVQVAEFIGLATISPTAIDCRRGSPPDLPLEVAFGVQLARSRLSADSGWHVTRLMLEFAGSEPRDVYSVAEETTGDAREADEFGADLAQAVEQGESG